MSEAGLEQKYIQEAFDTNWVVPLGPNVNGFKKDLEDFVNEMPDQVGHDARNKCVVALNTGTAAVHLALIACGVRRAAGRRGAGAIVFVLHQFAPDYVSRGDAGLCGRRAGQVEHGLGAAG